MRKTTVLQTIILLNVLALIRQLYIAHPDKMSLGWAAVFMITLVIIFIVYIATENDADEEIENGQYERMYDESPYSIFGNNLNNNLN